MTSKEFGKILQDKLTSEYGVELNVASNQQIYRSLALICRQMMSENHKKVPVQGYRHRHQAGLLPLHGVFDGPQPEDEPVQSGSGRGCQEGTGRRRHQSGQHF